MRLWIPRNDRLRLTGLDAARFLAAIAIIWQHTPESPQLKPFASLAAFAVPFFLAASILMTVESVRRNPDRSFVSYTVARFKRIYVPFLIWTAIYLLIRDLKHRVLSGAAARSGLTGDFHRRSGAPPVLSPFLLVVSLIVFAIAKLVRGAAVEWFVFAIALIGGTIVALMREDSFRDQYAAGSRPGPPHPPCCGRLRWAAI